MDNVTDRTRRIELTAKLLEVFRIGPQNGVADAFSG